MQRARQRAVHASCVVISAEFHALFVLSFSPFFLPRSEQVRACVRVLAHVRVCVSLWIGLGGSVRSINPDVLAGGAARIFCYRTVVAPQAAVSPAFTSLQ